MKKTATLITMQAVPNFGSILQAVATTELFKREGYEITICNYVPEHQRISNYIKTSFRRPIDIIKLMVFVRDKVHTQKIHQDYLKKYSLLSPEFHDADSFAQNCPKADIYVSGSDQIWNSHHNRHFNDRYLFAGVDGKKVSFSASFGQEELEAADFERFKKGLADYSKISIRETSGKGILAKMGYESEVVIDPTLLLSKEEWLPFASKRIVKEPYLLLYIPYNTVHKKEIVAYTRAIAKEKGLKIVGISSDFRPRPWADKTIRNADPGDFLSLMLYADFVVTNSFHGTAFSINLNKQFKVFMPSAFSTRIESIVDLCGLRGRVMANFNEQPDLRLIDYGPVNKVLEEERKKAVRFINSL